MVFCAFVVLVICRSDLDVGCCRYGIGGLVFGLILLN